MCITGMTDDRTDVSVGRAQVAYFESAAERHTAHAIRADNAVSHRYHDVNKQYDKRKELPPVPFFTHALKLTGRPLENQSAAPHDHSSACDDMNFFSVSHKKSLVDVFSVDDSEYPYFVSSDLINHPVITDS